MRSFDAIIIGAGQAGPALAARLSGDEATHGVLDMMNAGQPIERLSRAVAIHPTVSELIPTLLLDLEPWHGAA
jgi:2-polyprenyl-6-methoxyphenol hydroxylase-like FAD-dependent oxidoreductase